MLENPSCFPLHLCSMKAGHRVKSVSMGKFTHDELKGLEEGGNEVERG